MGFISRHPSVRVDGPREWSAELGLDQVFRFDSNCVPSLLQEDILLSCIAGRRLEQT